MTSVRAVLGAWRWLVAIVLVELVLASAVGASVRGQVIGALADFALPDDHLMYAIAELVGFHPQIIVAILLAIAGGGVLVTVLWTLLAPAVLVRLARGPLPAAETGGAWLGTLGGAIATTLWHLLLRAGLAFAIVGSVTPLPPVLAFAICAIAILVSTAALDVSRAQVVLHGAAGTSIRTALWGYVHAVKRPRLLATLATLQLLQWACAVVGLAIAVRTGGEAIGWARAAALVGTAIGLCRLHHVASAGSMPTPPKAGDAEGG